MLDTEQIDLLSSHLETLESIVAQVIPLGVPELGNNTETMNAYRDLRSAAMKINRLVPALVNYERSRR
jgi:hypothetical protein